MTGLLETILGNDDPANADPETGLTSRQRRQIAFGSIGQLGAQLLAAGSVGPEQRAPYFAQMGNVGPQMQEQTSQMMQQRLLGQKTKDAKAERDLIASQEFQAALAKLPPEQQALAKMSPAAAIAAVNQWTQMERTRMHEATSEANTQKRFTQSEAGLNQRAKIAADSQAAQTERMWAQINARNANAERSDTTKKELSNPFYQYAPPQPQAPPEAMPPQGGFNALDPMVNQPQGVPMVGMPGANPAQTTLMQPPMARPPMMMPPQGAGDEDVKQILPNWQTEEGYTSAKPFNRDAKEFQALPDAVKQQVHDMAMYRRDPIPSGSRSKTAAPINAALAAYTNGGYDSVLYGKLKPVAKEFSQAGVSGRSITNMDTAYGHLGLYYDLMKESDNTKSPAFNTAVNAVRKQLGLPEGTNIDLVKTALGAEISKYLAGAGVTALADREEWANKFSNASSPAQAQGMIMNAAKLMEERSEALRNKYISDTEGQEPKRPFLSERNTKKMETIRADPLGGKPASRGEPGKVRKWNPATGRLE